MSCNNPFHFAPLAALSLAAAALAAAQPSVTLGGTVLSRAAGAPVPGATVVLTMIGAQPARRAETGEDGRFAFEGIPPEARCRLSVTAPGFLPAALDGVAADSAFATDLRVELDLEPLRQALQVEDRVESVTAALPSRPLDSGQLAALPSNGRNLPRFAMLDPQVRNTQGLAGDGAAASRLSISAASFRTTYYLLDGAPNYDFSHGNAPQQKISVSAVQEFTVIPNAWSAEYGRSASGFIAATTRSGSAALHGEAFFYGRPSGIQAAPVAAAFRLPNELKQVGASAGGPLPGGRSSFFASYEQVRTLRGAFVQSPQPLDYPGHFHDQFALLRLDHRFTSSHSMALRVNANRDTNDNPNDRVSGFVQPGAAVTSRAQAAGGHWADHLVLGAATVNELRIDYIDSLPSLSRPVTPAVSVVRPSWTTEGGSSYSWYRTRSAVAGETLSGRAGSLSWKAGADWARQTVRDFSVTPFGEYRFAPGAPAPGQQPIQYTQTFGAGYVRQGQTLASLFSQNAWALTPRLTASFGLRYEYQSLTRDSNNFAPRLALAFDPTGSGNTVLRAAAGLFYDQYYMYISRRFFLQGVNAPTATLTLTPSSPAFPVFPDSLAAIPSGAAAGARDLYLRPERILNPYSLRYSLSVEHRFGAWVFTAEGVHSNTVKQMRGRDINAPAAFPRTAPGRKRTVAEADATRPLREYAGLEARNILLIENSGTSRYDALKLGVSRRFAGLSLESRYLWSSAMGDPMFFGEPNTGIPSDWGHDRRTERGPSDFHQRHRWVTHGLFDAPGAAVIGFVFTAASGLPVNPLTGVDNNGDTFLVDRPAGLARNSFRAPANASLDLSFSKRLPLGDRSHLELRAEAFNVLNRSNLIKVNATYGDGPAPLASFLRPVAGLSSSDPARQFQFGLKWMF